MEVFRLFRGFRMQTRKNCQPQSHPSVLECLKGHFRLKIQAFRNSAFLLLQRSKEIKVVAFSMCWEKPRSCARDSGICCEDCWSWNKLKLSVSSCLAYKKVYADGLVTHWSRVPQSAEKIEMYTCLWCYFRLTRGNLFFVHEFPKQTWSARLCFPVNDYQQLSALSFIWSTLWSWLSWPTLGGIFANIF